MLPPRLKPGVLLCAAVGTATVLGGGGPAVYPAGGKVVYQDGDPLPGGASVIFMPSGGAAYRVEGKIQQDGRFQLTTADARGNLQNGAPPGEYQVYVVPDTPSGQGDETDTPAVEMTSEKYGNPSTAGILVKIKPEENSQIVIEVERP